MDFFDEYPTGILMLGVENIFKSINETEEYRLLSKDDNLLIKEYREFQCLMVSSAIIFNLFELDNNKETDKKQIQTIIIEKCSNFLRKILTKEIKCKSIVLDKRKAEFLFKGNLEQLLIFEISILFGEYLNEVDQVFNTNLPKYFWKYDEEEIDNVTGEIIYGEDRYFKFILELLFPEEQIDYNDLENNSAIIGHKFELDLEEDEVNKIDSFIFKINEISKHNK